MQKDLNKLEYIINILTAHSNKIHCKNTGKTETLKNNTKIY